MSYTEYFWPSEYQMSQFLVHIHMDGHMSNDELEQKSNALRNAVFKIFGHWSGAVMCKNTGYIEDLPLTEEQKQYALQLVQIHGTDGSGVSNA